MYDIMFFQNLIVEFLNLDSQFHAGHAANLWPKILALAYPFLNGKCLSECLVLLVLRGRRNQMKHGAHDFGEIFAGCANLTKEMIRGGYCGSAIDMIYDQSQNVLVGKGLRLVLDSISCIKYGGLLWLATKCSSFVVLCRALTTECWKSLSWRHWPCLCFWRKQPYGNHCDALFDRFPLWLDAGTWAAILKCAPRLFVHEAGPDIHQGPQVHNLLGLLWRAFPKASTVVVSSPLHIHASASEASWHVQWALGSAPWWWWSSVYRSQRPPCSKPTVHWGVWQSNYGHVQGRVGGGCASISASPF